MYSALENAAIQLADRTKGTLDLSLLLALLDQAGLCKIENLPLSSTAHTRAANALREVATMRAHNLLPTFDSLQYIPSTNTEDKELKKGCIEPKVEPEITELKIPEKILQTLEGCGIDYELLVTVWFHEDATKRRVYRLRILKYLGAFAFRVAMGWVREPKALFQSFVYRGHPLTKQSPEDAQRRKAEKARAEFERGNDAHKIQQAMQKDAEEVQAQPLADGVARIEAETRKTILATLQARKPLASFLLVALKCAGIELKNPQKYNDEDAFTVLAALGA